MERRHAGPDLTVAGWPYFKRLSFVAGERPIELWITADGSGPRCFSRAGEFLRRYGELVQVELDALPPDALRGLFEDALSGWWEEDVYRAVLQREKSDVSVLESAAAIV